MNTKSLDGARIAGSALHAGQGEEGDQQGRKLAGHDGSNEHASALRFSPRRPPVRGTKFLHDPHFMPAGDLISTKGKELERGGRTHSPSWWLARFVEARRRRRPEPGLHHTASRCQGQGQGPGAGTAIAWRAGKTPFQPREVCRPQLGPRRRRRHAELGRCSAGPVFDLVRARPPRPPAISQSAFISSGVIELTAATLIHELV